MTDSKDFTSLLKPDHDSRPLWTCEDGRIFLDTSSPHYMTAYQFLNATAEAPPDCLRSELILEYNLTRRSLYVAASVCISAESVVSTLEKLSKNKLADKLIELINTSATYGKLKLVSKSNEYHIESESLEVLEMLSKDDTIKRAIDSEFKKRKIGNEEIHSFKIVRSQMKNLKLRCLSDEVNYPLLKEYDFFSDKVNPCLNIELKPDTKLRPYQEHSLMKMFHNGRAASGLIVLPCGAGKSLVGVGAATRIKKSCLCLVTDAIAVDQWISEFKLWSTIKDTQICCFSSNTKERLHGSAGVVITTYNMLLDRKRSRESENIAREIRDRDWGLILMDDVHMLSPSLFENVDGIIKSHCTLGLAATLVREAKEDKWITDLNFSIGPKLYEVMWQNLVEEGFIANFQCFEVWCPMTKEFMKAYLQKENIMKKQALSLMNPNMFEACEFLIRFHEQERRDKIIVFVDDVSLLEVYARRLRKPMINSGTSLPERTKILEAFKTGKEVNTVMLLKFGQNTIDIPEANVAIQISPHADSRRQNAQRLGRILRAKGKDEKKDAFFYSLVSNDTEEIRYSILRQQLFRDEGYKMQVITTLVPADAPPSLSEEDQVALLRKVLGDGDHGDGDGVGDDGMMG